MYLLEAINLAKRIGSTKIRRKSWNPPWLYHDFECEVGAGIRIFDSWADVMADDWVALEHRDVEEFSKEETHDPNPS